MTSCSWTAAPRARGRSDAAWSELAVRLCDRHFGIGADGVLLALPSERADARMRILNADGSEAEMCGNGIRCLARYVRDEGHGRGGAEGGPLRVETLAGVLELSFPGGGGCRAGGHGRAAARRPRDTDARGRASQCWTIRPGRRPDATPERRVDGQPPRRGLSRSRRRSRRCRCTRSVRWSSTTRSSRSARTSRPWRSRRRTASPCASGSGARAPPWPAERAPAP